MLTVPRDRHHYRLGADIPPALTVADGARVRFETLDCFGNRVTSAGQRFATETELLALVGGSNPVTGPVYVTGAQPGDTLAVTIERIDLGTFAPFAVTTVVGDAARIVRLPVEGISPRGHTWICPIDGEHLLFPTSRGPLRLPARAMVGTIGTAPPHGEVSSLRYSANTAGNVDCPFAREGATVYLPVHRPGGLLSIGDVHALMGDAEITGTALETNADVTVRVRRIPAGELRLAQPHLDDADHIGVLGCGGDADTEQNIEIAMSGLHVRVRREYGLRSAEAFALLGAVARLQINQCVFGGWTSTYASVPRSLLPGASPTQAGREPAPR